MNELSLSEFLKKCMDEDGSYDSLKGFVDLFGLERVRAAAGGAYLITKPDNYEIAERVAIEMEEK